jgi:hypothetical protein
MTRAEGHKLRSQTTFESSRLVFVFEELNQALSTWAELVSIQEPYQGVAAGAQRGEVRGIGDVAHHHSVHACQYGHTRVIHYAPVRTVFRVIHRCIEWHRCGAPPLLQLRETLISRLIRAAVGSVQEIHCLVLRVGLVIKHVTRAVQHAVGEDGARGICGNALPPVLLLCQPETFDFWRCVLVW